LRSLDDLDDARVVIVLAAEQCRVAWNAVAPCARPWQAQTMGLIEDRLGELGLQLPAPLAAPQGVRLPFALVRAHGNLAYVSGHGPFDGDRLLVTGSVGGEVSVEQAYEAARATGLSILASLKQELGDLDRVTGWVKALGFVKCAEGFNVTPAAINGFSDLILAPCDRLERSRRHARIRSRARVAAHILGLMGARHSNCRAAGFLAASWRPSAAY
jgi:enamine deaminase RidA (YjgF/YER057c/UK114 family)